APCSLPRAACAKRWIASPPSTRSRPPRGNPRTSSGARSSTAPPPRKRGGRSTPPVSRVYARGVRHRRGLPIAIALASTCLALSGSLVADPKPTEAEALEMSADKLELDVEARTAVLTGHVKLVKGGMTVSCPRVDVKYDHVPHVTWAKASGGVVA